jgi:diguanylate cyclase (GGDEF)-like protein
MGIQASNENPAPHGMNPSDATAEQIAAAIGIDDDEMELRKRFLEFGEADIAALRQIHDALESSRDEFAEVFYRHLGEFTELHDHLGDAGALARLKAQQARYFSSLTGGDYGHGYVLGRIRVGQVHQQIGLAPKWYIGAYRKYLSELLPRLAALHKGDAALCQPAFDAVLKVIVLDIGLALDSYFHHEHQQQMRLAHFDSLTDLPNRALFHDRLDQALSLAQRNGAVAAVLLVDLDHFQLLNDTLGHAAGDALLQEVARRLADCTRDADTVGRLGGDEFGIILSVLDSSEDAALIAGKILGHCARPYQIEGRELFVSASIGIALFPADATDAGMLVRNADTALYRAKELGRKTYQFFTAEMNQRAHDKMQLLSDLRHALEKGEFLLYYQPKLCCASGKITGFEALLRWQHPVRGLMLPDDFVPLLDEAGLLAPVGEWVVHSACQQARRWRDAGLGTPGMAVNVADSQVQAADFCLVVQRALESSGLSPACLEIELTESHATSEAGGIVATLQRLKDMGVRLAVDDFGTGHASLLYLKHFLLDSLKINRSFVRNITTDPGDISITRAIITLAHSLQLRVVAEGVETEGQLTMLVANQCDVIQGHLFSEPRPADEITAMLREGRMLPDRLLNPATWQRTLLLVDDEANVLAALKRLLRRDGYHILAAGSAEQGLELLASHRIDVIVSDQRMPGMTGVEFLRRVKTLHPDTTRLVLSGYTDLQSVTDAINEGAIYKFLTKPWDDGILRASIEEAFRHQQMVNENRRLQRKAQLAEAELAQLHRQLDSRSR